MTAMIVFAALIAANVAYTIYDSRRAAAYQQMDDLPGGFAAPEGRVKPWGTGHAVYAARNHITGPFGIIGSDDFFGRDTLMQLGKFCAENCDGTHLGMVGFRLANTLSESGSVSRGVCETENGFLTSVTERLDIRRDCMVKSGKASVAMLDTTSKWFGVTHKADKPQVQASLHKLHDDGTYPALR